MAHGFSATRSMTIDKSAESCCGNGFVVLLYDPRGFGASGGEPRLEVNPWTQTRGYLDAVEFVSRADGIDPDRIAIWGDSLSGGGACVAPAIDPRIRAVVVQVPAFGDKTPPPDANGRPSQSFPKTTSSPTPRPH